MLKVELHSHTTASDGFQTPYEIVQIARRRELDAIAVTDHNTFRGASLSIRAARVEGGPIVLPAAEVRTSWGDVTVVCTEVYSDDFPRDPFELRDWALARGCITIAVHPYNKQFHGIGGRKVREHYELFDAIEVWNAYTHPFLNLLAFSLSKETGLPAVSGSDAHVPSMVGASPSLVEAPEDRDGILEAIRRGRVKPTIGVPGVRAVFENLGWSILRRIM
ncbi:MAG: PHP domain-containing protein [Aeropyrum sp.]|nr:PHP domain-containing protein [Aeropyrum sp.]MCE4615931.1 PHP domain-containing protein [Aeropyrum sp.]